MVVRVFVGLLAALLLCECNVFGQAQRGGELTTIAYPVADLVVPVAIDRNAEKITNEAELMARILKKVAPGSWDGAGGSGNMRFEAKGGYLLHVRQSAAVHAELKEFLGKLQRGQVSLALRVAHLSEKPFENLRLQWSEGDGIEYALLDDLKLWQLLQAAQGEPSTHIMQFPKVTLFDGQDAATGVFDWMTFQTSADVQIKDGKAVVVPKDEKVFVGIKTRFLPVISADHKYVTVQVEIEMRNLISESIPMAPISIPIPGPLDDAGKPTTKEIVKYWIQQPAFAEIKMALAAKVPDERTIALLAGKVLTEEKSEARPPVLSKIPYLNRLFRNQAFGREAKTLIFLLTPRILAEPRTAHVERLREGIRTEEDDQFPKILSQGNK